MCYTTTILFIHILICLSIRSIDVKCNSLSKSRCNNNNSKVCMSAFTNLNALTCHNKIKYNDDTTVDYKIEK